MAKRKTAVTLNREVLANGKIRLSSPNGIIDTRNGAVHSEVVCNARLEKYFVEATNA